jgi:hypothetical protein
VFLINSRQRYFRCGLPCGRQALSLTYGRFFAEFLNEDSLVPLRILSSPTSVGLRYDVHNLNLEDFLGRLFSCISPGKPEPYRVARNSTLKSDARIYLDITAYLPKRQTIKAHRIISSVSPSHSCARAGILTGFPLATVLTIALGSPNPRLIAIAAETLDFRGTRFSRVLWLLVPTFSLPNAPAALTGPPSQQIGMLSYRLT